MTTKMMRRLKKGTYVDQHKFEGAGVDFKSKLIGITDVSSPRGDEICRDALTELKATALKNQKEKKEHKQKITLNLTLKGIRLIDELTERIDYAHPIHRISFISHDDNDKRTFGYIVGTKEGYKLFAIKTVKEAKQITATLKELFQEVFDRCQSKDEEATDVVDEVSEEKKTEDETKVDGPIEVAEEATEVTNEEIDDSALVWELNDQIKEMQNVGIPHSESFDMIDPFTNGKEVSAEPSSHNFPTTFDDDFVSTQAKSNPALSEFGSDPFGEKVDFAALPTADEIRKNIKNSSSSSGKNSGSSSTADIMNNSKSDDLFALDPVPQSNDNSKFSDDLFALYNPPQSCHETPVVSEEPLMKHDPFDEMKKTINELHKQNLIQQQQQQQRGYQATFAPQRMQQNTSLFNTTNPYVQNTPHQFMGTSNSLPPPIPARPTPVVPARPGVATNPFAAIQTEVEPSMGWTVLNTSPSPKEVIKPTTTKLDPFSFLDDTPSLMANSMSISNSNRNHVNGSKEILDLLG